MAYSSLTENEMRVVLEAREQSRREAEDLDRLKQKLREAFQPRVLICLDLEGGIPEVERDSDQDMIPREKLLHRPNDVVNDWTS